MLQSDAAMLINEFEIKRWEGETKLCAQNRRQLTADEIESMFERACTKTHQNGVSKHAQFYVNEEKAQYKKSISPCRAMQCNAMQCNATEVFFEPIEIVLSKYIYSSLRYCTCLLA